MDEILPYDDELNMYDCAKCGVGKYNIWEKTHCCGCNQFYPLGYDLHCCKCFVAYDEGDEFDIDQAVKKERAIAKSKRITQQNADTHVVTIPHPDDRTNNKQSNKQSKYDKQNDISNYYILYDNGNYDLACYNCGGLINDCIGFHEKYMKRFPNKNIIP